MGELPRWKLVSNVLTFDFFMLRSWKLYVSFELFILLLQFFKRRILFPLRHLFWRNYQFVLAIDFFTTFFYRIPFRINLLTFSVSSEGIGPSWWLVKIVSEETKFVERFFVHIFPFIMVILSFIMVILSFIMIILLFIMVIMFVCISSEFVRLKWSFYKDIFFWKAFYALIREVNVH